MWFIKFSICGSIMVLGNNATCINMAMNQIYQDNIVIIEEAKIQNYKMLKYDLTTMLDDVQSRR